MDNFGLDKNLMISDMEIEAFFAAPSTENDVSLKQEPILIDDHEPENDVPKPMKGLYEEGPTPFLKKTYAMVDDSQTDSVISWSETEMSFVIWDHNKFSADILPKHFKHCNFSSFIRQLNTYGFKKLSPDRWEYAVEGFQKGKDYLLKNIRRRRHQPEQHVLRDEKSSQHSREGERLKQEAELEQLESDTDMLRTEIMNIQKEQENSDNYLLSVKERLRRSEQMQQQMFICMAKAFQNPLLSEILMQRLRPNEAMETAGTSKKQKLIAPQCNKDPAEASYYPGSSQPKDGFATIDFQGQKVNEVLATKSKAIAPDSCLLLENLLLADDVVSETEAAKEHANIQSKLVLELEELITKTSASWDVSMKEMVEQAVSCNHSSNWNVKK
ncbi:heat stress transcription factor A-7a-like [Apium graveolens]|uniref:heat stress transcription factor A-7a-like n=1 Tax=Apium graveolens TaxID=4045 RepID=UPI003D7C142B